MNNKYLPDDLYDEQYDDCFAYDLVEILHR